ncbi:MAG: DUF2341 domain-containing protein [Nannocystales bacterium]
MRWSALAAWAGGFLAATVGLACQEEAFFFCDGVNDCGGEGVCEPNGACSFPDLDCPSGRRFGEASVPPFGGECTADTEMADVTSSTAGGLESSSSEGPAETASSEGTSSTGATMGAGCPEDWWDCEWSYRRRVSVAAGAYGLQSDVPVAVRLGPGRIDYELMQADAEDLRFVSSTGSVLPHEIETWDPNGTSMVWTSVDVSGGADDHFWIYYGNAVAETSNVFSDVWPDVYAAVWHMAEGTEDSSANGQHAVAFGEVGTTQGQIFEGAELLTQTSRLEVASSPAIDDLFLGGVTVSAWIRPWGWGHNGYGRILDKGTSGGWLLYLSQAGELTFGLNFVGESDSTRWSTAPDTISLATWSHVVVTVDIAVEGDQSAARFYLNGVEQVLASTGTVPDADLVTDVELPLAIGNRSNHGRQFEGILDEVRLERTVRTPEWVLLQHKSGRDTLLEFGEMEGRE